MKRNWKQFFKDEEGNLQRILNDLENCCYEFHEFYIFDRYECGKQRIIYASCPEDQIVDTLLDQCLQYVFMDKKKIIHPNAYGSIKGKGQHELRSRIIKKVRNRDDLWVGICDTSKYYPTINHEVMMKYLRQHIKDKWLLWLCEETISRMEGVIGMALGLASSNILGHVYHASIDWAITVKYGFKDYYRFCDDKIILGRTSNEVHTIIRIIRDLTEQNQQNLKPNWKVIHCKDARFEFLGGFINSHNARLKTPSRRRIERRFKRELKRPFCAEITSNRDRITRSWAGVNGGLKGLNVANLRRYWKRRFGPYFERLRLAQGYIEILREQKRWHQKVARRIRGAEDFRSEENKRKFPLASGYRLIPRGLISEHPIVPPPSYVCWNKVKEYDKITTGPILYIDPLKSAENFAMNLFSKTTQPKIVNKYTGEKVTPDGILYTPVKIHHYEFMNSVYRPGNRVLVAQISYINEETKEIEDGMLMTEAYGVVKVLMGCLDQKPPHYTKFIKNKNGYITLTGINKVEEGKLKNVPDPIPTDTPVINPNQPKPKGNTNYKNDKPFKIDKNKNKGEED